MFEKRLQELKLLWTKEATWLWFVPGLALGGIVGFLVGVSYTFDGDNWFIAGIWPEIFGTVATLVFFDRIVAQQNRLRDTRELQQRLLRESRGRVNDIARAAIDYMREKKWLRIDDEIGLLKGADLRNADLQNADLFEADLSTTNLRWARLDEANLRFAKLEGADLWHTYLYGTDLQWASLENAYLVEADLTGAVLFNAQLTNVIWQGYVYEDLKTATLPDGTKWTPNSGLSRFTDFDHPEFKQTLETINEMRKTLGMGRIVVNT